MKKLLRNASRSFLLLAGLVALLGWGGGVRAQSPDPPRPYATLGAARYDGPGRQAAFDLTGTTIRIGILAPLHGPQQADGEAIVRAARMALAEVSRQPLPGGRRLVLAVGDESGPAWGRVADALNRLVFAERAVAVVTSASGATAHLSEQVGNRIGVPILTLSSDVTTTEINLPWIFRLGPSDALQARAIARDIYRARGLRRVILVTEDDHDGRVGRQQFAQAAQQLQAPPPVLLALNPLRPDAASLLALVKKQSPQALVFWTRPETARAMLEALANAPLDAPLYLSQQAAQQSFGQSNVWTLKEAGPGGGGGIFTVVADAPETPARADFVRRYRAEAGAYPGPIAAEAYDAVCMVARAVREAGPNRARVRDRLAVLALSGVSGRIAFDGQGNDLAKVRLIRLR